MEQTLEQFNREIERLKGKVKPSLGYNIVRDLTFYGRVRITLDDLTPVADIILTDPPCGFKVVEPGYKEEVKEKWNPVIEEIIKKAKLIKRTPSSS